MRYRFDRLAFFSSIGYVHDRHRFHDARHAGVHPAEDQSDAYKRQDHPARVVRVRYLCRDSGYLATSFTSPIGGKRGFWRCAIEYWDVVKSRNPHGDRLLLCPAPQAVALRAASGFKALIAKIKGGDSGQRKDSDVSGIVVDLANNDMFKNDNKNNLAGRSCGCQMRPRI